MTIEILREEKIFPEEDYEYVLDVNGRHVEVHQTYGHFASLEIRDEVSDDEREEISEMLWAR